jgi:hypothetical protein
MSVRFTFASEHQPPFLVPTFWQQLLPFCNRVSQIRSVCMKCVCVYMARCLRVMMVWLLCKVSTE